MELEIRQQTALFFLFVSFTVFIEIETSKQKICFYTNWSQFRKGPAKFLPEDIDPFLCTHISYAHLQIDIHSHKLIQRQKNDHLLLGRIVALKKLNPGLKVIVSVGGWSHDSKLRRFSNMAKNKESRSIFINSAIEYMKTNKLDGLSIDWEYPTKRGTSDECDTYRYTLLLREIKQAYQAQNLNYTISASVSAGRKTISTAYDVPEIAKVVDWVNVMAYALHGAWEDETGHHTAMKGGLPNVPDSLSAWIELACRETKSIWDLQHTVAVLHLNQRQRMIS